MIKIKQIEYYIILILVLTTQVKLQSILNSNNLLLYSRMICDYKDKDGQNEVSIILNCSLSNNPSSSSGINSNLNTNLDSFINGGQIDSSISSTSTLFRLGFDKSWRPPWESIIVNNLLIKHLIWRNSRLSELGEYAFKDLTELQIIDLSHNKLQNLSPNTFNYLFENLKELDLSSNLFQQVPYDLFTSKSMRQLEILKMNENPIVSLTRRSFEHVKGSLKSLELNNCQIRSIDPNTFDDMKHMESISLVGNHLRYLNEPTFVQLNLRAFYIHDNPLICDCNMRWLIQYLEKVAYQQSLYESQNIVPNIPSSNSPSTNAWKYNYRRTTSTFQQQNSRLSVAAAAEQLLRCDQPNSLKSKPNFLQINENSFMCDVQVSLRDPINDYSANFELGEDAILICDVYGDPEPNVYWSFGQKPIEKALNNEEDKYIINERSYLKNSLKGVITNKTSELRIKNLKPSDIGVYTCTGEIVGSNNRKQITFDLKEIKGGTLSSSLASASGVIASCLNLLSSFTSTIFNRQLSSWTLLLLLAIFISLLIFILVLSLFICWKCGSQRRKSSKSKFINDHDILNIQKEKEKLLIQHPDQLDHHHNQNHLSNDSSTTLISNNTNSNNNKMTNSIRMAYPNPNSNNNHDIYANHSLLTTTSTTTGSYLANQPQTIAIDTSNHTPRFHLIQHQIPDSVGYYDDLRYTQNEDQLNLYSSPYRQNQQSYSPMIRRDDPTVPLYATLKPKLYQQRNQNYSNYSNVQINHNNNYGPYLTMHRNMNNDTPPLPMPRKINGNYQQLPPPPPPPPVMPPIKPKRTFEYNNGSNNSRDLHSDSGAYLLDENSTATPVEFEQLNNVVVKTKQSKKKLEQQQGSATSLDEEDLDLNDLKDFEDVTFDNLRKPGEEPLQDKKKNNNNNINNKPSIDMEHNKQLINQKQKEFYKQQKHKIKQMQENNLDLVANNSEQSLLLKSSSSSSDKSSSENTINNLNLNTNPNGLQSSSSSSNSQQQSPVEQEEKSFLIINNSNHYDSSKFNGKLVHPNGDIIKKNDQNSKVYEETEI
jgi:hypothetical protein